MTSRLEELWEIVRNIPAGTVMGYGQVGKELSHPVSGLLVGKWMAMAPEDVPWWRVVGGDGSLKTAKRGPEFAITQRTYLEREGILFEGEKVPSGYFLSNH